MRYFVNSLILALYCASAKGAELNYDPCWVDGRSGNFNTSYFTLFRSLFLDQNEKDVSSDVEERIAIGDRRFIAVYGFGISFPGLGAASDFTLVCKYGWRGFGQTSDAYESIEKAEIGKTLKVYAEKYNTSLLSKLRNKINEDKN